MFRETGTEAAPWFRVPADDRRRARLNCIAHLLSRVSEKELPFELPELGKRLKRCPGIPKQLTFRHEGLQIY